MSRFLCILTFILMQTSIVGTVVRVIDGDTIQVRLGDRIETVRYIGVNTPETVHLAASAFNRTLVEGRQVRLELDVESRDHYGRLLAYVYTGSLFVNTELVRQGYAQVMTVPPNVRHADEFVCLQRQARLTDRGLWGIEVGTQGDVFNVPAGGEVDPSSVVDVYHREGCHHLRHSCIAITIAEARERGYSACRICKPPH